MTEYTITNIHGIEFEISRGKDFNSLGEVIDGKGWFAEVVKTGMSRWFESEEKALESCHAWRG